MVPEFLSGGHRPPPAAEKVRRTTFMTMNHPYQEFGKLKAWKTLNRGIQDLETNGDPEGRTARADIVGHLAKRLCEAGLLVESEASVAIVNLENDK